MISWSSFNQKLIMEIDHGLSPLVDSIWHRFVQYETWKVELVVQVIQQVDVDPTVLLFLFHYSKIVYLEGTHCFLVSWKRVESVAVILGD